LSKRLKKGALKMSSWDSKNCMPNCLSQNRFRNQTKSCICCSSCRIAKKKMWWRAQWWKVYLPRKFKTQNLSIMPQSRLLTQFQSPVQSPANLITSEPSDFFRQQGISQRSRLLDSFCLYFKALMGSTWSTVWLRMHTCWLLTLLCRLLLRNLFRS